MYPPEIPIYPLADSWDKHCSIEQHTQLRSKGQRIEHLKLIIEKCRRTIFGRKSEKLSRELGQLELRLEELQTQAADQYPSRQRQG